MKQVVVSVPGLRIEWSEERFCVPATGINSAGLTVTMLTSLPASL
jgi:hypothetical protein